MEKYHQRFSRQTSNSRVLQNDHFLSKKIITHTEEDMNRTEQNLAPNYLKPQAKKISNKYSIEEDYEAANFKKALMYKHKRSYYLKTKDEGYKQLSLFEETKSLKHFGLGPYFYVEFMRRICWMFLFLSLIEGVRIYISFKSSGLSSYSASFSTYLITSTLGNFNGNIISSTDPYLMALIPAFIFLLFVLFYLCWKCHFYSEIDDEENNNFNIKPQKFCIEVESTKERTEITEQSLRKVFEYFGPIYEISIIKQHKNKLQYFEKLEHMQEQIRQIELELMFESDGNTDDLNKLRDEKEKLLLELQHMKIRPKAVSAYIHFEYEKSKVECLSFFNKHYLFNTCPHACFRCFCCCCIPEFDNQYKLHSNFRLLIKEEEVPTPEDINWESFQLTTCSKIARFLLALFIILIFLALSCAIIGLCTIYVSTHSSNCDSVTIPSSLASAQTSTDSTVKKCYCNANLLASLTDSSIQSYCSAELQSIYIEQGIQYAIIFTSALTNFLFGLVVDNIVDCTRPTSQSYSLKVKTLVYTLFLIFNTIILPILLYSDIFGFKASSYVSFLTVISSGLGSFLEVESLQFYLDYSQIWYRNVSPIFTNYLIFDILGIWIMFIVSKYQASFSSLSDKQGKILQKHMNKQITSFQFSPYKEYSSFMMILFMALLLNAGIPVLIPLAWLNLLSRYVANRSLIQYSSTRVDGLGVPFNELPHTLLPILLISGCINGCWMLTANTQIYPSGISFSIALDSFNNISVMQRQLYLPFYIGLALFVFAEYLFYHIVIRFCSCLCSSCFSKKMAPHPTYTKTFTQHIKTLNILTSYNIKSNDKMRNAVTRMERYISKELK